VAWTGCKNRAAWQHRTARIRQPRQNRKKRTARKEQPKKDGQNIQNRKPEEDSQNRIDRTGLP
jgi:hypothetical protein